MSRNVVAHGTPDRSFAGLMDHLTGFNRNGASGLEADSEYGATFRRTSQPNSAHADESLTNLRSGAKALLPLTERKPGAKTAAKDAAALSYEKALSLHARRRSPPLPVRAPATSPGVNAALAAREKFTAAAKTAATFQSPANQSSPTPETRSERKLAQSTSAPETARNLKRTLPKEQKTEKAPGAAKAPEVIAPRSASKPADRARLNSPSNEKRSSPSGQSKGQPGLSATARGTRPASPPGTAAEASPLLAGIGAPTRRGTASVAVEDPRKQAGSKARGRRSQQAKDQKIGSGLRPGSTLGRSTVREAPRREFDLQDQLPVEDEAENSGTQLELLHPLAELDQRKTIVSVRLTEQEFACLRDRAEESGISVSAYMRSCVVDADQLRAQVKLALQEMRALAAPGSGGSVTALAPSGKQADSSDSWHSQTLFRLILRPFTFLFGPLFPSRRSA